MNKELVLKIQSAVVDMMSKVKYTEDGHTYERVSDGTWLQGISTVSNIMPKDWLSAWGAKEAVKFLGYSDFPEYTENAKKMLEKLSLIAGMQGEDGVKAYLELLKEAKGASARKSKEALLDGKAGHLWCETYVKDKIRGTDIPKYPDGMLERPLKQFVEWADKEVDYWILSEARVAYPEKGYAGTLDAVAVMKNGRSAVIDFKFASHISEDYNLQLAGYASTFEPYEIKIDDRIIVRLPKTLTMQEWVKAEKKYRIVENNIEVVVVDTNYEFDRDAFVGALPVKKWINIMLNRNK